MKYKNCRANKSFRRNNPGVVLPPDYLMYESFQLDYQRYFVNGKKTAEWLLDLIKPYSNLKKLSVLDWGCGPGRIIRHLPELMDDSNSFSGTDYNSKSIEWCKMNLNGIKFNTNELMPPLSNESGTFDLVYGISIFTHLSKSAHEEWLKELHRVLRRNGLLFLTLHGDAFYDKLEKPEQALFKKNELVLRAQVKEGHRTFVAFHPPEFVKKWADGFELLNHIQGKTENGNANQDVWIFRKI